MKKQQFKKAAAAVLCLALCLGGCSGNNTEQVKTETKTQESRTGEAKGEKTQITVWHMLSGVGEEAFSKIVNDFNESQDTYYVVSEYQGNWYDSFAKFKSTPKEALPDIYQIVVECMGYMKDSDRIIPVQDYIEKENFDVSGMQENIRALYTVNDTLYCMPLSVTMLALSYNVEALEKAGVDPDSLKTIADVDAAAKKIVDSGLTTYGWSILNDSWQVEEYMCLSGQPTFDNNNGRSGRVTACLMDQNDAALTIFRTFDDYLGRPYNYAPTTGIDSSDVTTSFLTGEMSMLVGSSQWILKQQDAIDGFTLGQVAAPITNTEVTGSFSPGGNSLWMVDKDNEETQKGAWEFIKYLWQDEVMGYYAAYTGYTPVSEGAYNSQVYKEFREKKPFVENIWKELEDCRPEYVGALFGSFYDFRNTVMDSFGRMLGDDQYSPEAAIETIVKSTNENITLYNEANPES